MRRPVAADAPAIFGRYAADPEVTCYMSWARSQVGPYLIEARESGRLLGSTGMSVQPERRAITGYILARDAWGQGFATEALHAMVTLAGELGLASLRAACHAEHRASARVLEKCGFVLDPTGPSAGVFPNLGPELRPTLAYVRGVEKRE